MDHISSTAEINIHLRARLRDRELIDQAAELAGISRSQFMLSSALKEARNLLLDQTSIPADAVAFQKILSWMDARPTTSETKGMKRLLALKPKWAKG